jgi:hypothetical protein
MTKPVMKFGVVVFLCAALAASAGAQPQASTGSWANLSEVAPGTETRVSVSGGRTLRGSLQKVTSDSLAINAAKSQETLLRTDIKRVDLKRNGRRGRNTLIGLGIGAGGGLAVGAGVDSGNHTGWFPNFGKAVFTPLGAIVGAIVGVAIPTGGWHQIYRAP